MEEQTKIAGNGQKQPWQPVTVRYAGDVAEVIRGGGGKLTTVGGDPGEGRKQRSSG